MKTFGLAAAIAAAAALFATTVSADVDPIVIKGSKFFYKTNGTQFYIRGVAYQQGVNSNTTQDSNVTYQDPLANVGNCKRDIPILTQLRTNTIRVYAIDPTANHDECMQMLQDAGIYVIADLSQPSQSIIRDSPTWDVSLYQRYTSVVDTMQKYNNVLGFFGGNEVSNAPNNTDASAFVKAAVRDTKSYIKQKGYRTIGVGYATNDDASIRVNMANYFNCGDAADAIDFWGYNIYSWCGDSSFQKSGYDVRTQEFANYSVPVFFAEYGCNTSPPRLFTEVGALYGSQMNDVWSGGIVYMYFEETNNFGLVSVVNDNSVSKLSDFTAYSTQIAKVSATGVQSASYNPTNTAAQQCPPIDSNWGAKATPLPPSPNADLCNCMYNSLGCVVKSSVDSNSYEDLFGQVCGYAGNACAGIAHNATTGTYGAYGMCNSTDQLAFAFNAYAKAQNNPSACSFGGSASSKASATASGSCAALMSQAGSAGTGTVTSAPTGTGGAGGAGGAATTTSKKAAAAAVTVASFDFGMLSLGLYLLGAGLAGVGMVIL